MKNMQKLIYHIGSTTNFFILLVLIAALNVSWLITLDAFGKQFEQIAGILPIDLQNTSSILSPAQALDQVMTYTSEAKIFYWVFFALDNLMPPLAFGAYALLWAYYLSRHSNRCIDLLKASPLLLIPWGVGLFDWFENLCFISVITNPTASSAFQVMEIGLIFVRLKAVCLFTTFGVTMALTVYHAIASLRRALRIGQRQQTPQPA